MSFGQLGALGRGFGRLGGGLASASQPPWPPVAMESKIAFGGTSFLANAWNQISANNWGFQATGMQYWAQMLSGSRLYMPPGANCAVAGSRVASWDTQLTAILALSPKVVYFDAPINDVLFDSKTAAYLLPFIQALITRAFANGVQFIVFTTMTPTKSPNAMTGPQNTERLAYNTGLLALRTNRVLVADVAPVIDVNTMLDTDGLHPIDLGGATAGAVIAVEFNKTVAAGDVLASIVNAYSPGPDMTGTGGTLDTATGTVPNGWQLYGANAGGATITGAIATVSGRPWAQMTFSGTYTGTDKDAYFNFFGAAPGGIAAGDRIELSSEFEYDSLVNVKGITARTAVYTSGFAVLEQSASLFPLDTNFPPGFGRMVERTPLPPVAAGTPAFMSLNLAAILKNSAGSSSAGGNVRYGRNRVREVT